MTESSTCPSSCFITGEEVRHLKNRVKALEDITALVKSSRLSASPSINIIDPLDRSSSGSTLTRSDNTINLGAAGPVRDTGSGPAVDSAALQRTVQQLVRAELRSDAVRGTTLSVVFRNPPCQRVSEKWTDI